MTSSGILFVRPSTFEQLEVSKDLFGKAAAYLKGPKNIDQQPHDTPICYQS
jgi:translation elongation factor P/translation initiation factor 5A